MPRMVSDGFPTGFRLATILFGIDACCRAGTCRNLVVTYTYPVRGQSHTVREECLARQFGHDAFRHTLRLPRRVPSWFRNRLRLGYELWGRGIADRFFQLNGILCPHGHESHDRFWQVVRTVSAWPRIDAWPVVSTVRTSVNTAL